MLCVKYAQKFVFVDDQKSGRRNRRPRAHTHRLPRHASFTKKVIRTKHGDHGFFSGPIDHGKFHATLLNIHNAVGRLTLRVDRLASAELSYFSRHSRGIEKHLRIERTNPLRFCGFPFQHTQVEKPLFEVRPQPLPSLTGGFPQNCPKRDTTLETRAWTEAASSQAART